ncbi:MAG: sigma-70 family RNA polymerase sigma factor [Cytophagales bacterium]|nr:sigma-70 family RNA polymerase sigma factor [Armatimonadota bacterium]
MRHRPKGMGSLYQDPVYGPALRTAHYFAAQMGLCPADCEDCAMEFLLRQIQIYGDAQTVAEVPTALRRRSASNHVKNTVRARATRQKYEETPPPTETNPVTPLPEQETLRRALWQTLSPFFQRLPPASNALLIAYLEDEMSVHDLAEALGEKPNTVEQRLIRARKRLRQLLEAEGISAAELQDYLRRPVQKIFDNHE